MEYHQDVSLVDDEGWNVLHWVGMNGTVRHLEKFGQQTIEMLIFTTVHFCRRTRK